MQNKIVRILILLEIRLVCNLIAINVREHVHLYIRKTQSVSRVSNMASNFISYIPLAAIVCVVLAAGPMAIKGPPLPQGCKEIT